MDKYAILIGYFDKQEKLIEKLFSEIVNVDLSVYEKRYLFALKAQQFYSAIEDLLKQIAKGFENHIEGLSSDHKGLLIRLNTKIPNIRPSLISDKSFRFLDHIRSFRHFIRHAYDCELEEKELVKIQEELRKEFPNLRADFNTFKAFVQELAT